MNTANNILVVDELKINRDLIKKTLAKAPFQVVAAHSGKKAESILDQESIDLVITSLTLPQEESLKLLKKIRSSSEKIPVIFITEKRRIEAFRECSELGGDGFISYPLHKENIVNTVNNTLESIEKQAIYDNESELSSHTRCLAGYNLKGVLGKGSMGIVYLAEKINDESGIPYAMKVLHKPEGRGEEQVRETLERFLREAEVAASLTHPHIVRIIDFGIAEEQQVPYIVMHFIPGRSLRHFIEKSGLNYIQKSMILRQVAYALTAIHSHGICHRDIKPENIIMDQRLNVKVTDFGVARLPNSNLTQEVKILGTPAYIAPEAFRSPRVVHSADIFSLGVVAYEFLLGRKPFCSDSIYGYRHKILNDRPTEPRKLDVSFPLELQYILAKALKKKPKDRFQSASDVVLAFDGFLDWASNKVDTTVVDLVEYFDKDEHTIDPEVKAYENSKLDWK